MIKEREVLNMFMAPALCSFARGIILSNKEKVDKYNSKRNVDFIVIIMSNIIASNVDHNLEKIGHQAESFPKELRSILANNMRGLNKMAYLHVLLVNLEAVISEMSAKKDAKKFLRIIRAIVKKIEKDPRLTADRKVADLRMTELLRYIDGTVEIRHD